MGDTIDSNEPLHDKQLNEEFTKGVFKILIILNQKLKMTIDIV